MIDQFMKKWNELFKPMDITPQREEAKLIAEKCLGSCGKILSQTKNHVLGRVYNGNVCTKEFGKIWYGDIDIKNTARLETLAKELGSKVYVLREMDARFGNENDPVFENAVFVTE